MNRASILTAVAVILLALFVGALPSAVAAGRTAR